MPKKPTEPVYESDDDSDQVDTKPMTATAPAPVENPKPVTASKSKKERTPAQKEAFAKALSILRDKRKAVKDTEKEILEKATAAEKEAIAKAKFEKAKNHKKKLPPVPSYVTMNDLQQFKLDLLSALPKPSAEPIAVPKPISVPVPVPVPELVVAPIPEPRIKKQPVVTKPLTGHSLLDQLFFS